MFLQEIGCYLLPNHVERLEHRLGLLVLNVVFATDFLHHGNDLAEVLARHVREETESEAEADVKRNEVSYMWACTLYGIMTSTHWCSICRLSVPLYHS